tara:strand:- start:119 stop:259 length:141 start_codon:yes stop_codon:yes gene_type:complete
VFGNNIDLDVIFCIENGDGTITYALDRIAMLIYMDLNLQLIKYLEN